MRIAIVTDAWRPQVNGVVTTLGQTAERLQRGGHKVLVINPTLFFTIPCPTYPDISLAVAPGRKVRRLLQEHRPEAVHIATEGPLGWAARSCCLKRGMPFTTSYHTRFPEYVRLRAPVPLSLSYAVVRRFHDSAARTMVATPDLKKELESKGFDNLRIWSRGVDTDLFRPRRKIYLKGKRPVSIYVGRVAVEKNIEDFLCLQVPGTKYVVGDGPAMAELKNRYPEVCFVGFKHGEELACHIAAADVFVFPSRTDTFGLVMLEAMASGVPVAAYPVTGPRQLIENGENGWLDGDLRTAFNRALEVDANSCREYARRYSWEACTDQFQHNLYFVDNPQEYWGEERLGRNDRMLSELKK